MGLLVYFTQASVKKQIKADIVLPKLAELLSQVMPMSSVEAANAAVYHVTMKVPKMEENDEINCDEKVMC